jgi:hypothetical protein
MTKQKEILVRIAKEHGLQIQQAEEIWKLLTDKVFYEISKKDKMVNGVYDSEKFKIIHVDNFGKFIPNKRNINHANMCLEQKKKNNGS